MSMVLNMGLVFPYAISPVPKQFRKISNRGRKAAVASVITSSPYKSDLIKKKLKKKRKLKTKKSKKETLEIRKQRLVTMN